MQNGDRILHVGLDREGVVKGDEWAFGEKGDPFAERHIIVHLDGDMEDLDHTFSERALRLVDEDTEEE